MYPWDVALGKVVRPYMAHRYLGGNWGMPVPTVPWALPRAQFLCPFGVLWLVLSVATGIVASLAVILVVVLVASLPIRCRRLLS